MITRSSCSWTRIAFFHQPYPQPSSLSLNLYDSLVFGTGTLSPLTFPVKQEDGRPDSVCSYSVPSKYWRLPGGLTVTTAVCGNHHPILSRMKDLHKGYLTVLRSQSLHRRGCPLCLTLPSGCSAVSGAFSLQICCEQSKTVFLSLLSASWFPPPLNQVWAALHPMLPSLPTLSSSLHCPFPSLLLPVSPHNPILQQGNRYTLQYIK